MIEVVVAKEGDARDGEIIFSKLKVQTCILGESPQGN